MTYRPEIDGLRALAVLPVIFFHAGFQNFSGGFIGVDVFFVISGYLISTIIISELNQNNFSIVGFYERRARRILPALFLVMVLCLPPAWFLMSPVDLKGFGQSLVAVSTFSSNILFWLESGYFDTESELKPLLHTWSLAVEEQYYILFPIFLATVWKFGFRFITSVLLVFFFISLFLSHIASEFAPSANFYLLPSRGWELLIGVFIAFYIRKYGYMKSFLFNQLVSLIGLSLVALSIFYFNKDTPFPSLYALIPTLGTGMLILASVKGTLTYKFLSIKPIVGIGLISYSAYLWHQPLLAFTRHLYLGHIPNFLLLLLCAASLFFAWISWRYVEKPFRNKQVVTKKMIFQFSFLGILFFSSIGLVFHFNDGFSQRIKTNLDVNTMSSSPLRSKCHTKNVPCEYFGDEITWATFGDSHVVELSYALGNYLKKDNIGIQHNSFSSCQPSLKNPKSECYEWTNETIQRLMETENIKNVVISYRLTGYMYGESLNNYPAHPDLYSAYEREAIWVNLISILETLTKDKNVFFIIQPPELPNNIQRIALRNKSLSDRIKGVTREWWQTRNLFVYERLHEVPPKVKIIDLIDTFCDAEFCYANDQDGFLYFDHNHVSVYGASIIVKKGIFKESSN